jgi:hypothetical protein
MKTAAAIFSCHRNAEARSVSDETLFVALYCTPSVQAQTPTNQQQTEVCPISDSPNRRIARLPIANRSPSQPFLRHAQTPLHFPEGFEFQLSLKFKTFLEYERHRFWSPSPAL